MLAPEAILAATRQLFPDESWEAPERLTGGSLNDVYRIRNSARSMVVKHAPPYVAANPEIPLSPGRLAFEVRALSALDSGGALHELTAPEIRPPRVLGHHVGQNVLFLEDLGAGPNLAEAIARGERPPEDAGGQLGRFIGNLHRATLEAKAWNDFDNAEIQRTRLEVQYRGAASYLETLPNPPASNEIDAVRRNATALGEALLAPGRCLTMGDLWPPSVLSRPDGLRLIDWEFAHFGQPLQDTAHFAAHCWMHALSGSDDRFLRLWAAFAHGYDKAVGDALARLQPAGSERAANVHAGTEILARVAGPFATSGPFAAPGTTDECRAAALHKAIQLTADPADRFFLVGFSR
ncbi:MAG: phosphotransferase [Opitutales bacterium]